MVLKESSFEDRAILDGGVKWILTLGADLFLRNYKKKIQEKREKGFNKRLTNDLYYSVQKSLYEMKKKPTYLKAGRNIRDMICAICDEEEPPKLNFMVKWALNNRIMNFHRQAKHLIWKRQDYGTWNRPYVEHIWNTAHEVRGKMTGFKKEVPQELKDDTKLITFGIDGGCICLDADDPYYTAVKWSLINFQETESWENLEWDSEDDNIYYSLLNNFLYALKQKGKVQKMKKTWFPDISQEGAKRIDKKNLEVPGGERKERHKITRKYIGL